MQQKAKETGLLLDSCVMSQKEAQRKEREEGECARPSGQSAVGGWGGGA